MTEFMTFKLTEIMTGIICFTTNTKGKTKKEIAKRRNKKEK